jgi:hypothetical protein
MTGFVGSIAAAVLRSYLLGQTRMVWSPGGLQKAGKSTERVGRCACSGWKSLVGKSHSPPYPVHRGPGQGRQTDQEQVVAGHAVRGGVQAGTGAVKPIHPPEGGHQRVR